MLFVCIFVSFFIYFNDFYAERFLTDERRKYRVVVVVMRGCGQLSLNTSDAMNGARTSDLKEAIDYVRKVLPDSPLYGMGFSLGAGLMLKYLGQEGSDTKLQVSIYYVVLYTLYICCI